MVSVYEVTSTGSPTVEEADSLNLVVVVVVLCLASIVLVIVPVLLLRKRCLDKKAIDAEVVRRPVEGRRRKKKASTASSGAPDSPDSVIATNVYSELSSSFVYPTSEFDSVFDDGPTTAFSMHVPQLENITEHDDDNDDDDDSCDDADDDADGDEFNDSEPSDRISERTNGDRAEGNRDESGDVLYAQPPDEEREDEDRDNTENETVENELYEGAGSEGDSVYYEPPASPGMNSIKVRNVSVKSATLTITNEKERKESVYENISNVQREDSEETQSRRQDEKKRVSFGGEYTHNEVDKWGNNGHIASEDKQRLAFLKEREAYDDSHIYVNDAKAPVIEVLGDDGQDHLYDVPKYKEP